MTLFNLSRSPRLWFVFVTLLSLLFLHPHCIMAVQLFFGCSPPSLMFDRLRGCELHVTPAAHFKRNDTTTVNTWRMLRVRQDWNQFRVSDQYHWYSTWCWNVWLLKFTCFGRPYLFSTSLNTFHFRLCCKGGLCQIKHFDGKGKGSYSSIPVCSLTWNKRQRTQVCSLC